MEPSTSISEPVTRVVELLDLATKLKSSPVSVSDTSAEPTPPVFSPVSGSYSSRISEALPPTIAADARRR